MMVDPSGLITIETVDEHLDDLTCFADAAEIWWNFKLTSKKLAPGWIVQMVKYRCDFPPGCPPKIRKCPTQPPLVPTIPPYWEAWHVSLGNDVADEALANKPVFTDDAIIPVVNARCAAVKSVGFVRFYTEDQVKTNPPSAWRNDEVHYKNGDCEVKLKGIHTTQAKPDWWKDKDNGKDPEARRWESLCFNCCAGHTDVHGDAEPRKPKTK
jgi:hypothetical protein